MSPYRKIINLVQTPFVKAIFKFAYNIYKKYYDKSFYALDNNIVYEFFQ